MQDYRDQLENMGASLDPSYHAAILLHNLPDSWSSITQAIKILTCDMDMIEESLEANLMFWNILFEMLFEMDILVLYYVRWSC